jgi:Sigma-70, region 4
MPKTHHNTKCSSSTPKSTVKHAYGRRGYYMDLEDIARELEISREGVRQVQERALGKLKAGLEARGFTLEDLLPDAEPDDCAIEPADMGMYKVG